MATVDAHADDHHHDDHDHPPFIAHHFDDAEQQFDSGKLGIWLFLVTEVLFFSGLFVAYTLYRNHHPEIFQQAHVFLDKYLGGLNTIVLLFSSLTMALAVRSAQLGRNKNCGIYILITMVCASMFLGVKAVEYSHKWDMGIWVRSSWSSDADSLSYGHHEGQLGIAKSLGVSDRLIWLSAIPAVLLAGSLIASVIGFVTKKELFGKFMLAMSVMVGGYFLGAGVGQVYQNVKEGSGDSHEHASLQEQQPMQLLAMTQEDQDHADDDKKSDDADHSHDEEHSHGSEKAEYDKEHPDPETLDRDIGIFFSIYYCMTGLHAIHIIAGIIALAWIYWRCLAGHWRSDYFGPVDYVGLYWHLVDLIWIYLFPLLYLID
ncbi:MAG: cytochrome c oxidase subunit 3 [Planctomycetota bacterium]